MARGNLNEIVQVLREHVYREYEASEDIESWRKLSEIPSADEIIEGHRRNDTTNHGDEYCSEDNGKSLPDLPVNIIDGPWQDIERYVGTHYKLLREDAIAPLRKAVAFFKAQPMMLDNDDVSIYTHVYIVGMTSSFVGLSARIEFSFERAGKQIRWQQSKRLQQGTIVALSPAQDKFKTICKVAVIAARPLSGIEQNPPQIDLFWANAEDVVFDPMMEYVMMEARSGYFEASRHMLVAMQKLMTESFPLSEHLVNLHKSIGAPEFVKNQPMRDLNSLVPKNVQEDDPTRIGQVDEGDNSLDNVDILGQWPKIERTSLDQSQMDALQRMTTKRLAIVQGPPGTGKTFTSISALKIMLDDLGPEDPPIIVAAQTNHAIDQLLNLAAPIINNFLRLGGRSKAEDVVIKEHTAYELVTKSHTNGRASFTGRMARKALEATGSYIESTINKALKQGDEEARLLLEFNIISQEQYDSLYDENWVCAQDPELPPGVLALWLGVEQLMDPPRCLPTDKSLDEEGKPDFETLEEDEAEFGRKDDSDLDMLSGRYYPIKELFTGRPSLGWSDKRIQKELASRANLWDIPQTIRGQIYRYFRRNIKERSLAVVHSRAKVYNRNVQNVKIAKWQELAKVVNKDSIKLIGCTTTGLSKYRGFIASLRPRTLFIEEAAETLEGTIMAAMFDSLQQLILVGDHQQLQASCNNSALSNPPYNLAVSMFERLVNNGLEYTMLNRQRRMIAEIRQVLNPFYPNLRDHHSVLDRIINRKPIPGMGGRDSYFFHHQWPENRDDSFSRFNVAEATMIAYFFNYLVFNGIEPSKITVLTFYNGQRKEVIGKLRKLPDLTSYGRVFNVFTVDSYQGEENDIILLSLVRSNSSHNIGFLENKNRAVVSLSRARRGLYIFGNAISLLSANAKSFDLWKSITSCFKNRSRLGLGSGMPVVCSNHGTETMIRDPIDWRYITGGCSRRCNGQLPCGHLCPLQCHPFSHEDMICKEPCHFMLPCGHLCIGGCGNSCRCQCNVPAVSSGTAAALRDEALYPSLDDVLGAFSTSNIQYSGHTDSRAPSPLNTSEFSSTGSSPTKWRQWDAKKADRALEELRDTKNSANGGAADFTTPVFKDIHRAVTIKNGARIRQMGGTTTKIIPQNPTAEAPHTEKADVKTNNKTDCDVRRSSTPKLLAESLKKLSKLDVANHVLINVNDDEAAPVQVSASHLVLNGRCPSLLQSVSSVIPRAIPINESPVAKPTADSIEEDLISFD